MKTQYYTACSLDGFIATEDHSLDWLFSLGDVADTGYTEFIAGVGALVMGSHTYEWVLNYIQNAEPGSPESRWPYEQPCHVFTSRTLPAPEGADIAFASGDVVGIHDKMKAQTDGRNIWIVGGGELVGQFYDARLLDELILTMGSVTLKQGMPLLPRRIVDPALSLTSAKRIGPGFAELRYNVLYD